MSSRLGQRGLAVHLTARFFGTVVEETFVARGEPILLGRDAHLALPIPEGRPYLARITPTPEGSLWVDDGAGGAWEVTPGGPARSLTLGPVEVEVGLVERAPLRRTEDIQWWGSVGWLAVVLGATLAVQQGDFLWSKRCEWFGVLCPPPRAEVTLSTNPYTAEYLARLLRKDYEGEDDGTLEREEREHGERETNDIYLPSGAEGPVTEMGGAEETGPEEVAGEVEDEPDPIPEAPKPEVAVAPEGVGEPVELPGELTPVEAPEDDPAPSDDNRTAAQDREGWGLQDWYDTLDQEMEAVEVEAAQRLSRERLRIDPEDPLALTTLSYYQYLAQDYDGAAETYDKYIDLFPEDPSGYNNKALIYKRLGDYAQEEALYRVALALDPDDVTVLNNLGVCLAHQGRYPEALAVMRRLEALDPDDPYADLHRAKIHAEIGNDDLALSFLERALAGMAELDTLHHIEFRQDIRLDPSFAKLRGTSRFHAILVRYYGDAAPTEGGSP